MKGKLIVECCSCGEKKTVAYFNGKVWSKSIGYTEFRSYHVNRCGVRFKNHYGDLETFFTGFYEYILSEKGERTSTMDMRFANNVECDCKCIGEPYTVQREKQSTNEFTRASYFSGLC